MLWNYTHCYPQIFCGTPCGRPSHMPGGSGVWRCQYRIKSMDYRNAMAAEGAQLRPFFPPLGVQEAAPAARKGACEELGRKQRPMVAVWHCRKCFAMCPRAAGGPSLWGTPPAPSKKQGWPSPRLTAANTLLLGPAGDGRNALGRRRKSSPNGMDADRDAAQGVF